MSPQFVDFDQDGKLDIVAGTYDGSPHLARGTGKSWQTPTHVLDRDGARIVLNQFWNYDTKKWEETRRCDPKDPLAHGHATSAFAWDWDGDGDLDLLLGDYKGGHLYLRRNDGKRGEARFATTNEPVLAGKKPLHVGGMATPRVVDWDGDGLMDLVIGSMGGSYEGGGGVFLFKNVGTRTEPVFSEAAVLIPPSEKKSTTEPLRPDTGLYPDVVDFDGDGDLDLVVGGYTHMVPKDGQKGDGRMPFVWLYENKGSGRSKG